jgi:hypothetical protein
MRKMKNQYGIVNIVEHIMTRNFWEYYITDDKFTDDIVRAVVMGDETEIGDISLSEIKPYVTSKTKRLNEIMPAEGWEWVEA